VAIIMVVQFFISVALSAQSIGEMTFPMLAKALLISQLACIFAPAALMTIMLTSNPTRTLLLERTPEWKHLWAAVGLALLAHPLVVRLAEGITRLYPVQEETQAAGKAIEEALAGAPNWWMAIGLMALLPAICEELAFRGFVLSGLRHLGHKWWAIALSAVAFGLVHPFLHQKITATCMGLAIGYVAVQTGSLWTCILLHGMHNALQLVMHHLAKMAESNPEAPFAYFLQGDEPLLYQNVSIALCAAGVAAIMWGLHGVSYRRTAEEQLEEARQRQDSPMVGA
jgi:sodium transport system permease protein